MSELFELLKSIDERKFPEYSQETKKRISPFLLLKWMSFSDNPNKVKMLNASVNKILFKLYRYPELCLKLLSVCGTGKKEFYNWKKSKNENLNKMPKTIKILKEFYTIGENEAVFLCNVMNADSIIEMDELMGNNYSVDDIRGEFE